MGNRIGIYGLFLFFIAQFQLAAAQSNESTQLLLNVEKLAQFRQMLTDMKKGYSILNTGYTTIKDLSEGNFSLHKTFLDGLLEVSPVVRKYKGVADIIRDQVFLVKEYRSAVNRFEREDLFNAAELSYLGGVYDRVLKGSLQNLDELLIIISAQQLRMSDSERLRAIDAIHEDMRDKLVFIRHFTSNTALLGLQRAKEKKNIRLMERLYGLPVN